jgi:hypothetical protein
MKTRALFLFLVLCSFCALGQDVPEKSDTVVATGPKNAFKFLPVNMALNSLSFEYERKFSPKSSFILGIGIPSPKPFAEKFGINNNDNQITKDEFSTMTVRAAYRHYAGNYPRPFGFYFSPYLKYQKISASANNYRRNKDFTPAVYYNENYDIKGTTLNLGIQWGVQFLIAKIICVDFYFLGLEAGLADLSANVTSKDINMIDKVESGIRDNVDQLPSMFSSKISVNRKGPDQIEVKGSSMPYPWIRSGISIGVAF